MVLSTSSACSQQGRGGGSLPPVPAGAGSGRAPHAQGPSALQPAPGVWGGQPGSGAKDFGGKKGETRQKLGRSDRRVAMATARRRWTNTIGTRKVNPAARRQPASLHPLPGTAPGLDPRELWGDPPPHSISCLQAQGSSSLSKPPGNLPPRASRAGSSAASPRTSRTCKICQRCSHLPMGLQQPHPPATRALPPTAGSLGGTGTLGCCPPTPASSKAGGMEAEGTDGERPALLRSPTLAAPPEPGLR